MRVMICAEISFFFCPRIKEVLFPDDKIFENKGLVIHMASVCGGALAIFLAPKLIAVLNPMF
jgi:hypothetical protein